MTRNQLLALGEVRTGVFEMCGGQGVATRDDASSCDWWLLHDAASAAEVLYGRTDVEGC